MFDRGPSAISPTAHYTGEVWRRHGLSSPELGTWQGRLLHGSLQPLMVLSNTLGGDTLEDFLLARHRIIDALLEEAITSGRVGQVVEIAAGMSPRGLRFSQRFAELDYIEADLPAMADRKRRALRRAGARHRVVALDAFATRPGEGLVELAGELDIDRGLMVITEGLLNYFPRADDERLWGLIADTLKRFPSGLYVADVVLGSKAGGRRQRLFGAALGTFVGGRIHFPLADEADAASALRGAGFDDVVIHRGSEGGSARGADRIHVVEGRTGNG